MNIVMNLHEFNTLFITSPPPQENSLIVKKIIFTDTPIDNVTLMSGARVFEAIFVQRKWRHVKALLHLCNTVFLEYFYYTLLHRVLCYKTWISLLDKWRRWIQTGLLYLYKIAFVCYNKDFIIWNARYHQWIQRLSALCKQ